MKKESLNVNRQNSDERDTTDRIRRSLECLDDSFSVTSPPLAFFEQHIRAERERMRKKWRKELVVFTLTAVILLSIMLMALFAQPSVYVTIQAMAVIFAGGYALYVKRKVEVRHG